MRKILILIFLLFCLPGFSQERKQPTPEQIQAYLRTLTSHPDQHVLNPDSSVSSISPYRGTKNYGKRIAVFGGSLSVNKESDAARSENTPKMLLPSQILGQWKR